MNEDSVLKSFIAKNKLKLTRQRIDILKSFLETEGHISAEELYRKIIKKDPSIGLSTVYRTIKLLCECGLAQERQFGEKQRRFEHHFKHIHHDHLLCMKCGEIVEFKEDDIEKLQKRVSDKNGFEIYSHKLELYGVCPKCRNKKGEII